MTAEQQFDLQGGAVALDFANTVGGSRFVEPREYLGTYEDLIAWAKQTGVVSQAHGDRLRAHARRRPADAAAALARAKALREGVFRVFDAVARDEPPPKADLRRVTRDATAGLARAALVPRDGAYAWAWAGQADDLDRIRLEVARAATELLGRPRLRVIGECASETCSWLFLDTSRNRSRRWCSMRDCGNRAKVRAFYARSKRRRVPE